MGGPAAVTARAATLARRSVFLPLLVWAIVLAIFPWTLVHVLHSNVDLGTNMLIFAVIALGFNFLYGHTGELSFGHAAFVGIAAYATALVVIDKGWHFWPALLVSVAASLVLAFILARLIVPRSTGIYFAMIMLAVGQVLYYITDRWNALTGGDDGMQGVTRPPYILPWHTDMNNSVQFYAVVAVFVWLLTVLMWRIVYSPFGAVCHAIRENRQRAEFLGYDVIKYKINAFVLSAVLPAFGGVLYAYYNQSVNPDTLRWTQSGDIVMMTILGGAPTFWGPVLGAGVFKFMQQYVSSYTQFWEGYIGIVFVGFVLFAPQGIWGLLESGWKRLRSRSQT
jgi:branched-chain amino acid transport system permease protein